MSEPPREGGTLEVAAWPRSASSVRLHAVQRLRGGHVPAAIIMRRCLPGGGRGPLQSTHTAGIVADDTLGVPSAGGVEARRVCVGSAVAGASGPGATKWPSSREKSAARRARSRPPQAPSSGMTVWTAT